MLSSDDRASGYIIKHLNGTLTESDQKYLGEWLDESEKNPPFFNRYNDKGFLSAELEKIYAFDEEAGWEKFTQSSFYDPNNIAVNKRWQKIKRYLIITGIVILASICIYLLLK